MPPVRAYDDETELTNYVFRHYSHLFSAFEQRVHRGSLMRRKNLSHESGPPEHPRLRQWGGWDDPEVSRILEEGPERFFLGMRDRILKEHADIVFINRCSRCQRIVATPKAQQCLWCGHDWHPRPA
ncbi:MAG: hypothetical protein EOO71_02970 [Myxococcaceae bacterium]|nr:MAG: hypothetical protein EOO71_02970 [Myxococcaceae bacterium]